MQTNQEYILNHELVALALHTHTHTQKKVLTSARWISPFLSPFSICEFKFLETKCQNFCLVPSVLSILVSPFHVLSFSLFFAFPPLTLSRGRQGPLLLREKTAKIVEQQKVSDIEGWIIFYGKSVLTALTQRRGQSGKPRKPGNKFVGVWYCWIINDIKL